MKKLYIPTSTFNFNNILSSESISPKTFYSKRNFGYTRWISIPENDNDNAILLYSTPFCFSREASDIEDHPMLIEIQTEEIFKTLTDGIFYCDHTIYLSPWTTRFIFFDEQDYKITLSISDSSLETKMIRLYQKWFSIEHYPTKKWNIESINIPLNENAIKYDQRINKMKGMLYGYYIGALLSATPEYVKQHNAIQELQNTISAILSSADRTPTISQREQINSLLFTLQKDTPAIKYLEKQLIDPLTIKEVWTELSKFGVVFPTMISTNQFIIALLATSEPKENQAIAWLNYQKTYLQNKQKEIGIRIDPDQENIIINNGYLVKIAEDILKYEIEQKIVKAWINDILSSEKYNGKISPIKATLADDVTIKARDICQEEWNNSDIKISLNNMRRYINGSSSDFQWNNLLFSSIAAVIAKGNDWDELLAFMRNKNITDYRLAFAFYGELNGFANLTRDFTDILFNEDRNYVATVYREFTGQLLGIDVNKTKNTNEDSSNNLEHSQETTPIQLDWKQDVKNYLENNISSNKNKESALNLLKEPTISTIDLFLYHLQNCKGWTKGKSIHCIKNYFNQQNSLFQNQSFEINTTSEISNTNESNRLSMFNDKNWWNETADMISDSRARKQYLTDVEWFIENHNEFYIDKKKGRINGFYYQHPTENDRIIERFHKYLQNKLKHNPNAAWISIIYEKIPIEKIINYLKIHYDYK